uniref:Uncharacterized protein n=1 Tax=Branchiostoma floridae TaxID=7739 RepID=C3ZR81_BRAFL|eukprot:XP_002588943.1 hypothetical protein BRAFLDRAFT_89133 [Branchiostoma floridae]
MAEKSPSKDIEYEYDSDATYLSEEWCDNKFTESDIGSPLHTSTPAHDNSDSYDPSGDLFGDPLENNTKSDNDSAAAVWDPSADMFPSLDDTGDDNQDNETARSIVIEPLEPRPSLLELRGARTQAEPLHLRRGTVMTEVPGQQTRDNARAPTQETALDLRTVIPETQFDAE